MNTALKFIVTGASGYVGRMLIPRLIEQGAEVVVVGRDKMKLSRQYPGLPACTFEELPGLHGKFDAVIHLAVINNNAEFSDEQYHLINVDFTLKVANLAVSSGIDQFINVSSIHALDERNVSAYARTKREAAKRLRGFPGVGTTNLYLPFIYGDDWGGKLAALNKLPDGIARSLFVAISALKPAVHIDHFVAFVMNTTGAAREVVLSDGQSQNIPFKIVKRLIDLTFVVVTFGLLWPVLVVIWILIRLESPGPSIFAQERIGKNGGSFTCYKFRTMKTGTPQAGTHELSAASITKIGRILRATKIDELPQIWNILRNEISLVGPRPGLPIQKALYHERKTRGVFNIKPGITGLAQIKGVDMSTPSKLAQVDERYIALQSLMLDLNIMMATLKGRGQGDRVSPNFTAHDK